MLSANRVDLGSFCFINFPISPPPPSIGVLEPTIDSDVTEEDKKNDLGQACSQEDDLKIAWGVINSIGKVNKETAEFLEKGATKESLQELHEGEIQPEKEDDDDDEWEDCSNDEASDDDDDNGDGWEDCTDEDYQPFPKTTAKSQSQSKLGSQ